MMNIVKKLFLTFLALGLYSCVESPDSPEGVLSSYVNKRFKGASIEEVKDYFTSEYLESMEEVRDTKYEKLENLKKKKYKIISKRCDTEDCKITYFISYITVENNEKEFETETKKIATMKKVEDKWLINKIDHIKTYHDMVKDIRVESEN